MICHLVRSNCHSRRNLIKNFSLHLTFKSQIFFIFLGMEQDDEKQKQQEPDEARWQMKLEAEMITTKEKNKAAKKRKRQSTKFTTIVKQDILRVRGRQSAQKKRKVFESDEDNDDDYVLELSMTDENTPTVRTGRKSKKEMYLIKVINEKQRQLPALCGNKFLIHDRLALEEEINELERELTELRVSPPPPPLPMLPLIESVFIKSEPGVEKTEQQQQQENNNKMMISDYQEVLEADTCLKCNVLLVHRQVNARLVCPQCGISIDYLPSTNAGVAFGEDVEISVHAYEREKHFKTNLQQFSIDAPAIPDEVIERVHKGYARLHVKSVHEVRATPVKEVLKSLGLSDWRNFSSRITNRLNGVPSALFTQDEIKEMLQMFREIQPIWASVRTTTRKNFLNTNYLLNKFCRIKGWKIRAQCFHLMKERRVLEKQDKTFKKICRKKGWTFFRSI